MAAEINPVENPVDYRPWFDAVRRNNWCAAKKFLTLHPSAITATDSFGDTALHNATYKGCEQFVEELVQLMTEEQLETKNNNGQTALTIAAAKNLKIVKCLVAKNKKLLGIVQDSSQMTPILIAAKNDRWDIVRYLYSVTPLKDLMPDKGHWGSELVCYCLQAKQLAYEGLEQIVEELVQLMTEEQLETKNDDGETALTIAAAKNLKIVKCLVAKNKKLLGIAQDSSQMTPILIAAKNDRWDIVRYLYSVTPLEDLMPDKGPWGSELVCYCLQAKQFAYEGLEQIVEELVQLMTEEQLETKNDDGETALTIAAAKNLKIVKCLVAKNKKLLGIVQDSSQMTPILIAAKNDRWDIVQYLYSVTPLEDLMPDKGPWVSELVYYCLQAKQFAYEGLEQIVEELVQLTEEQLETKNDDGETALTIAAAKNLKIVKCLVTKNKKLLGIAQDSSQMTPILIAAKNDRWDIVRYLYSVTPLEDLMPDKGPWGSELVCYCLQAKQFDVARDLFGRCPRLLYTQEGLTTTRNPIHELALLPFVFPSGTSLKFWQQWIYNCIHVKHAPSVVDVRINVQNQENEQGDQWNSTDLGLLQRLLSRLSEFLGINHIRELKLHHVRSCEILDIACDSIKDLNDEEMMKCGGLFDTILLAVQNGIVELVITLCKAKPELLVMERIDRKSIFHHAVECRQENVYSLIYGTGKRYYLATLKDYSRKSMLDYAGMLSPLEKLDGIAGPALQMQRERQWYKEVESIVVTAPGASPFKEDCLTAARSFTQNHKELHEKGEKWMKDTANSYIIVSALIITIMFAAAFTVPGGNNQEIGFPIFLNKKLFMVFIVSDATSLFSSVTSALMFLCILTSRYAEDDFLKSLPTKMIIGLSTLFISVATMMVAFSSAIFLMLHDKSRIITPIIFLAGGIPVILFVWMQFPLLVEIVVSTYGRGIFDRKVKRWI